MATGNPLDQHGNEGDEGRIGKLDRLLGDYLDRLNDREVFDRQQILREHPELGPELLKKLEIFVDLDSEVDPDAPLGSLGDYTLLRQIGRGGMGVVYEAWENSMERQVALKVLPAGIAADFKASTRFMREAQAAGKLSHQNVVPVYFMGVKEQTPFYAMEFVEGETLAQILARIKDAEPETETPFGKKDQVGYFAAIANVFADVADGLQHAHSKGVIHRDIKPSNLILDGESRLRILDFGLALLEGQESLTISSDLVGTPLYMSPEQARQKKIQVDHRTDIYSLGATMYEAICGRTPFRGKDYADTLSQIIERDPVEPRKVNPRVPKNLETMVLKCLRKDRSDRYRTAEALGQDLRRFVRGDPIEARPEAPWEQVARFTLRHRRALVTAFLFLVLAVVGSSIGVVLIARAYDSARDARAQAAHDLYVSDMRLAHEAWESGNYSRFVRLLERHRPGPGEPDPRGLEWFYLSALRHVPLRVIDAASGEVHSLAWRPDGKRVAAGGSDGTARIWNIETGELALALRFGESPVSALAWSPDGRELAAVAEEGLVTVRDVESGDASFADRSVADMPSGAVPRAVAWSPDGSRLATAEGDGMVKIRRPGDGAVLASLPARETDCVASLVWRRDGELLAAAFRRPGRVVVWRTSDWIEVRRFRTRGGFLYAVAWKPDGSRLASCHDNHTIAIWSGETFEEELRFTAHDGQVLGLDWSPDGERLVSAGRDGLVKVWDLAVQVRTPVVLRGHAGAVTGVRWNPAGTRIASASSDGTVKIWDPSVSDGAEDHPDVVYGLWSPDGRWLAMVRRGTVRIVDAMTGVTAGSLDGWTGPLGLAFSPDGRLLATAETDDVLGVWDWQLGRELTHLGRRHGGALTTIAWSPDGLLLATGGKDGVPRVWRWNRSSLELARKLEPHETPVGSVRWSPDGSLLATTGGDLVLRVWNTSDWSLLHNLERGRRVGRSYSSTGPQALAWSPDGRRLAAAATRKESGLVIWEMPSGRETLRLSGHASGIFSLAWSGGGRRLATGGLDGRVRVWDPATGEDLLTLDVEGWATYGLAWHPSGLELLAVSRGGGMRLWDATAGVERIRPRLPPHPHRDD